MCSVSAVSDYYMHQWPQRFPNNPNPFGGVSGADLETKEMMRKVLELLDKIDKRLGDIECKDAEKQAFFEQVGLKGVGFEGTGI